MSQHYTISADYWTLSEIGHLLESGRPIQIGRDAMEKVRHCREYLDQYLGRNAAPVYGVNTGFGSLCDTVVSSDQLSQLQENLVKSHACGAGAAIDSRLAKLMLLLKIKGLSYGHSGVQPATLERLVYFYNHDAIPVIYEHGSLGASGDLAPLAHLSLPLLGLGELSVAGKRISAAEYLKQENLKPIVLQSKEGLALLNGTQFMSALGTWCWLRGKDLCENATLIAAMSLDAFHGRMEPFDSSVHAVRAHHGQVAIASAMRNYLAHSEIQTVPKTHVQDPYSFRCIPQVHGATADVLDFTRSIFEREVNSVTDNPTIFPEEDKIISAGNFHGQPLAIALDHMAIALAELGSISERRVYKLISGTRALPPFLVANPGLNSGFMIPQYTAASLVSRNKQLCSPCSVDTIDSSNGQEDHVSMGANAANKTVQVVKNLTRILGIELLNAAQALDFRRPARSSEAVETLHRHFRDRVPFVEQDVVMHPLMEEALCFVHGLKADDYK